MSNVSRNFAFLAAAFLVVSVNASYAATDSQIEKARLGRTLFAAFKCSTYAEMSENATEQKRLFSVGISAGNEFLRALKNGEISADAARSEIPIGVSMLLAGPSSDFILGRIFEFATSDAFDEVVKQDNGVPLDVSKWATDGVLKKMKAGNHYTQGNCALIK